MDRRKRTARTVALMSLFSMTDTHENVPVASFDGDGSDLISLIVGIEPIQDLHGYDSPWPAGGGKNLYNANALSNLPSSGITATVSNGTITLNGTATANAFFSVLGSGLPSGNYVFTFNNPVASSGVHVSFKNSGGQYFADTRANAVNKSVAFTGEPNTITLYVNNGTTLTDFVVKPQLETGSTPTSWTPYSNICPITGRTGANIHVSPTTDAEDGETYSITFLTEAGTVYGGTLDVTTGKLTVDRAMADLGTLTWSYANFIFVATLSSDSYKYASSVNALSDCYAFAGTVQNGTLDMQGKADCSLSLYYNANYPSSRAVYVKNTAYTDAAAFKTAMDGHQLVYELATPIVYDLTPTQVTTLIGTNNIWADTGDIKYIEYNI